MEVRIGVQNVAREIVFETNASSAEVSEKIEAAINNAAVLKLKDKKDRDIVIPGASLGYAEIGDDTPRPVGFAAQ